MTSSCFVSLLFTQPRVFVGSHSAELSADECIINAKCARPHLPSFYMGEQSVEQW